MHVGSLRLGSSRNNRGPRPLQERPLQDISEDISPPLSPTSSPIPAPKATFGVSTLCNKGKSKENQDSYVASANSSGSKCLVGVFDGHGQMGKIISEFAKSQLAKSLFTNKDLQSNPTSALESAFSDTQRLIERLHSTEAWHSGTTAVAAYQHRDKLLVANVGDSRAVLGQLTESGGTMMRAIELSSDQRPARQDERRRILSAGGVVQQSQYPMRQSFGGPPRMMRAGPDRVWDRTGCCGLCVTRSLGDLAMHPFVVAYPEILERQIEPSDRLLVLGSDGVWDRVESQEAIDIAARHQDPTAAANEITQIARRRWHQQTQGQVSDDITAVVVRLDHDGACAEPPPSAPATLHGMLSRPRHGTAGSARRHNDGLMNVDRMAQTLGSLSNEGGLRLNRPRRRTDGGQPRSRKTPLHNWKTSKD